MQASSRLGYSFGHPQHKSIVMKYWKLVSPNQINYVTLNSIIGFIVEDHKYDCVGCARAEC